MTLSKEWNIRYKNNVHMSIWPWADLVSTFMQFYKPAKTKIRVLELGCGAGANIPFFMSLNIDYFGIDASQIIIKKLKKRFPKISKNLVIGDFTQNLPSEKKFDFIIDRSSVTHNSTTEIVNCLSLVNQKLKKEVVEDITKMMADFKNFPDKQTITKTFKYSGNPDKVLKMWAVETGNTIPEGRFRLHTYEGTDIQKNLVKAFETQGDNPNIMKLAREYFPEMYKKKKTAATQQVRRILTEFADYVPRPNEPIPPGGEGYWKRRRKKINLALERMGDTTIGEQMADQIWKENQKWIKLANENPEAILKNKK